MDDRSMVGERAAAELLSVSVRTLQNWRQIGKGPAYIKVGRSVRYRVADLELFLAAGVRNGAERPR